MKQRILAASLVLAAVALCSSSVLADGNGDTSGGTTHSDHKTCINLPNQPCEKCCDCSNADSSDSEKRDCLTKECAQMCQNCSPAGVVLSAAESFAIIDDDGPAASPVGAACPSCATTGSDIPEDSQLMRLRLTRIWRSLWHNFGSFGKTMYTGYDYWVAGSMVQGTNLIQLIDPNNSLLAEFLDIGGGTFITLGSDDHLTQVVEATPTHVIFRKLDGRLLRFDWTNYFQNGVLRRARLRYIEDRNGNRINFNYLTPVSNSTPDVMMWTDAIDPYGRTFQFSYIAWQGENVLSKVILPDGRAITYGYDITINSFFANRVDYGNGIESTWSHSVSTKLNERNEALLPADHYRQTILLSHFADGRTRWIKRADGTFLHSRTSSEDAGVFTSLIYHRGETTEVKSTPNKVLLSHRQQRVDGSWEDLTTYEADDRRPVKGESQPDGRNWSAVRDSSNDRILLRTYPDGSTERFTYNGFAQPTSHTHPSGAIELWEYDAKGNLLSHTEAGSAGVEATETWSYNARGQVVRHTDFNGNQTTYEYAPNGDLKSLTLPQSTGQPAGTITYAYDAAGRLAGITDPAGRFVSYSYDAAGRLILTTFGDGSTEQMNYGSGEFSARLLSQKDRNGNQTHYSFDATGRVLKTDVRDAATGEILTSTTNTWDAATGRLMAVDRDGDTTEYTYDYKGRVLTTSVHPNANQVLTTTNVYDQYHLLSTTDPYGRKTSYTHDAIDRLLTTAVELTPAGATITTRNEYDAQGRQTAYIDGNGIRYEYDYDERDRKTRERSAIGTPVQAIETYSYDGNNNQLSITDKNGRTSGPGPTPHAMPCALMLTR